MNLAVSQRATATQGALSEDPDLAQAIKDLRPIVLELRERSKALSELPAHSPHRRPGEIHVADLTSRITVRAERLSMSTDALLVLINEDINRRARRGRGQPSIPTSRTLTDIASAALAREAVAHIDLTAAQAEMRDATAARIAAEEALTAYNAARRG
jgi:hypothetical protein